MEVTDESGNYDWRPTSDLFSTASKAPWNTPRNLARAWHLPCWCLDAYRQVGANHSGMLIPYRNLDGSLVTEGTSLFPAKVRQTSCEAEIPSGDRNLVHAFIPTGLVELYEASKCSGLCIVEGEFKAIALCESGFPAVGISGLYGFQNKSGELVDELGKLLSSSRRRSSISVVTQTPPSTGSSPTLR